MGAAAATRAGTFAAAGSAVAGAGLETEAGTGALGSLAAAGSDAMAGVVGEAGAAAVDSTIAAVDGIGDALLGDAAASGAGGAVDSLLVAAGDAGLGALSILPNWLVSGGLVAVLGELVFAAIALFAFFTAATSGNGEDESNDILASSSSVPPTEADGSFGAGLDEIVETEADTEVL